MIPPRSAKSAVWPNGSGEPDLARGRWLWREREGSGRSLSAGGWGAAWIPGKRGAAALEEWDHLDPTTLRKVCGVA
ncbi:hypothetical protein [Prosthecobacter fluviatilis]|uniref:Uncharacterized protein n=1 Tax=Prosthecobacter fluviatilis TaxID=445931 RepID=A0ABW0KWG6_9BACT